MDDFVKMVEATLKDDRDRFFNFLSLVKRMREAQKEWETDLANDYDEHWGKSWKKDRLESEVDEYLKKEE